MLCRHRLSASVSSFKRQKGVDVLVVKTDTLKKTVVEKTTS